MALFAIVAQQRKQAELESLFSHTKIQRVRIVGGTFARFNIRPGRFRAAGREVWIFHLGSVQIRHANVSTFVKTENQIASPGCLSTLLPSNGKVGTDAFPSSLRLGCKHLSNPTLPIPRRSLRERRELFCDVSIAVSGAPRERQSDRRANDSRVLALSRASSQRKPFSSPKLDSTSFDLKFNNSHMKWTHSSNVKNDRGPPRSPEQAGPDSAFSTEKWPLFGDTWLILPVAYACLKD